MQFDETILERLTTLQIAGSISQEDESLLNELISGNQDAFLYWQKLHEYFDVAEVQDIDRDYDSSIITLNVWDEIRRREKGKVRRLYYTVAAVVVIALGSLIFLMDPSRRVPTQVAGVQLQLPNGNTIDLSNTRGTVTAGTTTLNNANKQLSYATAAGAAPSGIATLTVPIGKDYKLLLSDGSEVWLNSVTTVKFPFSFSGDSREITITGEAYIKVASDAGKPFLVHLPSSDVQVLGTEFNINSYDNGLDKVALVKGSVKLQAPGQSLVLKPGTEAVYSRAHGIQTESFDPELTLSWREGIFQFDGMTLEQICRVLPRWFGIQVQIDNPGIAGQLFVGALDRNKPLEGQLKLFVATTKVSYYFQGEVLHFK